MLKLRTTTKICLAIIAFFAIEHAAGAYAVHTGLVRGEFAPPSLPFGGFDRVHEQKVAALNPTDAAAPVDVQAPPASVLNQIKQHAMPEKSKKHAQEKQVQASVPSEKPPVP